MIPNRDPRIGGAFDLDKPLYTISVASEILETHPRTLMMYEDLGLIEPYRTATNRRRYSQRNVRKLQVIQQLTREKGVNLAGVKYILMLLESLKNGSIKPPDALMCPPRGWPRRSRRPSFAPPAPAGAKRGAACSPPIRGRTATRGSPRRSRHA